MVKRNESKSKSSSTLLVLKTIDKNQGYKRSHTKLIKLIKPNLDILDAAAAEGMQTQYSKTPGNIKQEHRTAKRFNPISSAARQRVNAANKNFQNLMAIEGAKHDTEQIAGLMNSMQLK